MRGPVPSLSLPAAPNPVPAPRLLTMIWLVAAGLSILMMAGSGWTVALLGRWIRGPEAAALSVAIGTGALLAGGVLLDVVGLGLAGWQAYATVVFVTGAGWGIVLIRRRGAADPRP